MARARSGSPALLWSVVILGFGFVICLVLAILFHTQISKIQVNEQRAVAELDKFANAGERRQQAIMQMVSGEQSVVGQLLADTSRLKQIIIGSAQASIDAIQGEMRTLGLDEGQTLVREIRRLRAEEQAAKELAQQFEDKANNASKRAASAEASKGQVEADYRTSVNQLEAKLKSMQADVDDYRSKVAQQREALESQLQQARQQLQQQRNESDSKISQLDSELELARRLIAQLRSESPKRLQAQIDSSLLGDGRLLTAPSGRGIVDINLGRSDHVLPGMTFEIFDRRTGVAKNAMDEFRGKATVEVLNVHDGSSVARVVRSEAGQEIYEGDIIANLIYDPNTKFKFFVHGEYDIDNFGQPSISDRRRVESMILQWGGILAAPRQVPGDDSQLSYDVDFLVLGNEPKLPDPLPDTEVDPVIIAEYARKKKEYQAYYNLVNEAKALSIPILNQNRFLVMVGYYHR